MGQSLSQLYIHLTFGTKNRYPFIKKDWEEKLHSYMSGILKNTESPAIIINSAADHSHVLFRLSKNYALAKVVENLKKESSKWIKTNRNIQNFSWQSGYGAFSVSSSKLKIVEKYIIEQKEHHKKVSYQDEVEEFMKHYDVIEFNAEHFW